MDTLFSHVSVVTMDARMSVWIDAFVGVTDGKISYLGKKPPEEKPGQIIDGTGMVISISLETSAGWLLRAMSTISSRALLSSSELAGLSGFWGDTTNHTSSSPASASSRWARAMWPLWMGLNEPPKMPIEVVRVVMTIQSGKL